MDKSFCQLIKSKIRIRIGFDSYFEELNPDPVFSYYGLDPDTPSLECRTRIVNSLVYTRPGAKTRLSPLNTPYPHRRKIQRGGGGGGEKK